MILLLLAVRLFIEILNINKLELRRVKRIIYITATFGCKSIKNVKRSTYDLATFDYKSTFDCNFIIKKYEEIRIQKCEENHL